MERNRRRVQGGDARFSSLLPFLAMDPLQIATRLQDLHRRVGDDSKTTPMPNIDLASPLLLQENPTAGLALVALAGIAANLTRQPVLPRFLNTQRTLVSSDVRTRFANHPGQ
eukprot:TRINITY_DN22870_c0_g1_i1.p1 TRINITY_DN22870_c0_g1~~TRINITY_DN22870_c0_g1_i1.p1  ORF type:complete len:112 (+),score=3.13 TRINITY_DN22870_c0_g1_i1:63-398(+)